MKSSVKIILKDDEGKDEIEVFFEFDLSNKDDMIRFEKLSDILKKSDTVTLSHQHFFHQIKDIFQNI